MVTYPVFKNSYTNVVYYLMDHNPVLAEYLVEKVPLSLLDRSVFDALIQKHVETRQKYRKTSLLSNMSHLPSQVAFYDAVKTLANIYTFGSENIQPNYYRANKYIRLLKLMKKDKDASLLSQHIQKQKKNKSLKQ